MWRFLQELDDAHIPFPFANLFNISLNIIPCTASKEYQYIRPINPNGLRLLIVIALRIHGEVM